MQQTICEQIFIFLVTFITRAYANVLRAGSRSIGPALPLGVGYLLHVTDLLDNAGFVSSSWLEK